MTLGRSGIKTMKIEFNKPVLGYPDYLITEGGQVWNHKRKRLLKERFTYDGYQTVRLYNKGKWKDFRVHQLVTTAYQGICPKGMECRHLDGNKRNNHKDNLKWGTRSENQQDAVKHGTHRHGNPVGSQQGRSKLTEEDARMIVYMLSTGMFKQKEIASLYSISPAIITGIKKKNIWRHIWT